MSAPLLAVDAPSLLYRAFFALPDSITDSDKRPVNALLGSANLVLNEISTHAPRVVCMCFGAEAADYRTELLGSYHADRPEMPEALASQWARAEDFYSGFGWRVLRHDTLEADDLLGTLADLETEVGGEALLLTGDRDMFQCASAKVRVLYVSTGVRGGTSMGPEEVRAKYGIDPGQVPDFIALRGDPSDGIPGAKGVGEKTAAELLRTHGTLETILDTAIRERRPKLRTTLTEMADQLREFKRIATLQDAGIERPADAPTEDSRAAETAREFGMNRLADRLESGSWREPS